MFGITFIIFIFALAFCQAQNLTKLDVIKKCYDTHIPSNCIMHFRGDVCDAVAFYELVNGEYIFYIAADRSTDPANSIDDGYGFVAVGFSSDQLMGDDVTVDCIKRKDERAYPVVGINTNDLHTHHIATGNADEPHLVDLMKEMPTTEDLACQFKLTGEITVDGKWTVKMHGVEYYLLLGAGTFDADKEDAVAEDKGIGVVSVLKHPFDFNNSASSLSITVATTLLPLILLSKWLQY